MQECYFSWAQVISTGVVSLVAAFAGAFFAFRFQNRSQVHQRTTDNVAAVLDSTFCFIRMVNVLGAYRKQIIEPYEKQRLRFISIPPTPEITDTFVIPWSGLTFLLSTEHANVPPEISVIKARFDNVVQAINRRSSILYNQVQPALRAAGYREGSYDITEENLEQLIGHGVCVHLRRLTDDIVTFVDELIGEIQDGTGDLRGATLNIYPEAQIPEFKVGS